MKMFGSNDNSPKNINENLSLWRRGKIEYKKFTDYHVKKSTFIKTTLFGILLTILAILPILFILIQLFDIFYYNPSIKVLLICIAWALFLICNGLSNYFTVILTKKYISDDEKMQAFNEKAIAFYQTFNIGLIIFSLFVMIFFIIGVM